MVCKGAQRFSASKMESLTPSGGVDLLKKCSTLFSIKDGITGRRRYHGLMYQVLNAFQHQRWNHGMADALGTLEGVCSTLFSIKDGITHPVWRSRFAQEVLNAFQHQRWNHRRRLERAGRMVECSTLFSIKDGITLVILSNAAAKFTCSTLFSIKDGITYATRCAVAWRHVLNAFQHQRWNHFSRRCKSWSCACAQRFSASKMESHYIKNCQRSLFVLPVESSILRHFSPRGDEQTLWRQYESPINLNY